MKRIDGFLRRSSWLKPAMAALLLATGSGCMTTYDAWGRPVQSVDPGAAVVGAAAAGIIGYAIASDRGHHHYASGGHWHGHGYHHRPVCP